MAESKQETEKKPLSLNRPGRLELKKTVESGVVKQSFSHGRSKAVTVEVKKKRTFKRGESGRMSEVKDRDASVFSGDVDDQRTDNANLSPAEREARLRALKDANETTLEAAERAFEKPTQDVVEDDNTVEAEAATADPTVEEIAPEPVVDPVPEAPSPADGAGASRRAEADESARRLAAQQLGVGITPSNRKAPVRATPAPVAAPTAAAAPEEVEERTDAKAKRRPEAKKPATPSTKKSEPRRREGKLTITQALEFGDGGNERKRSEAASRRRRERQRQQEQSGPIEYKKQSREVVVPEIITVQELANRMAERANDVIKALMKMDVMASINDTIEPDTAELIIEEFGHKIRRVAESDVEIGLEGNDDDPKDLKSRPPVVTIMGHVDHGKTSLLDALRETDVAGREAGGITQHIGAYQVILGGDKRITFLDTPGHAAFTQMRARGANATDIVVLVVAADDGVQPQTIEAISHSKAAGVPMIVAINKSDVKGADANKVRTELLQHDIQVEGMGGEVLDVEVSAKDKTNLDKLEEAILLQSELLELKANPDRDAQGVVVEAKLERGRGPVATVLVQRGSIRVGDIFIAGSEWGRVRALINDRGENIDEAGPSSPVEVLGLQGAPSAGDDFMVVKTDAQAREISEYRQRSDKQASAHVRGSIEEMFSKIQAGEAQHLPLVIKTDVQGSAEAIVNMLENMSTDEVNAQVLYSGVGAISESDITLARASGGIIIAFNVRANKQVQEMAQREGVDIRYYSVIYNINDDIKGMLSGMLAPEKRETFLGYAETLEIFNVSKVGKIAGCRVTEGVVKRGSGVRLLRDNVVIHEGTLGTLRRFKDEVKEVRAGMECGMGFENYNDIKVGDQIECYDVEEVAREL